MDQLPTSRTPSDTGQLTRLIEISVARKTRTGKLLFAIVGVLLVVFALFISILIVVFVAAIAIVFALYVLWVGRRVRHSLHESSQTHMQRNRPGNGSGVDR